MLTIWPVIFIFNHPSTKSLVEPILKCESDFKKKDFPVQNYDNKAVN